MLPTVERLESREVPTAFGAVDGHFLRIKLGTNYVWADPELRAEVQTALDFWNPHVFRSAQGRQPRRGTRLAQEWTPAPVRATIIVDRTDALDANTLGRVYPFPSVDGQRISGALVQISTEQDSALSVTEVIEHEFGHVLGLLHPSMVVPDNANSVMQELGTDSKGPGGYVSRFEADELYARYLRPWFQFEWRPDAIGAPKRAPVRW